MTGPALYRELTSIVPQDVHAIMLVECDPDASPNVTSARVMLSEACVMQGMQSVYTKPALFSSACSSVFGPRPPSSLSVLISGSEDAWVPLHCAVFTPDYARRVLTVSARTEQPVRRMATPKQLSPLQRPKGRKSLPREAKRICTERVELFDDE